MFLAWSGLLIQSLPWCCLVVFEQAPIEPALYRRLFSVWSGLLIQSRVVRSWCCLMVFEQAPIQPPLQRCLFSVLVVSVVPMHPGVKNNAMLFLYFMKTNCASLDSEDEYMLSRL